MRARGRVAGWCAVGLLVGLSSTSSDALAAEAQAPQIWVTWRGVEPDKGASAWFVKKFVRSDARFRELAPTSVELGEGEPFDVPQAELRRTHRWSVYEQLMARYPVNDPAARKIGAIIHDIEINLWRPKQYPESALIEAAAIGFAKERKIDAIPLSCYSEWFEAIYQRLRTESVLTQAPHFPADCLEKG